MLCLAWPLAADHLGKNEHNTPGRRRPNEVRRGISTEAGSGLFGFWKILRPNVVTLRYAAKVRFHKPIAERALQAMNMVRALRTCSVAGLLLVVLVMGVELAAQDASTGAIRGIVADISGARVATAQVVVTNAAMGNSYFTQTDANGGFVLQLLPPGEYQVKVDAAGMAPVVRTVQVDVGGEAKLSVQLNVEGSTEQVNVSGDTPTVETQPSTVSTVIAEDEIRQLPLNSGRYSDLVLLTPGVTQDPRGLTSSSTGDLSFGGLRGFQTSFLVDGSDANNGFFAQARGRYRTNGQLSNETVQEFRVSSNTFGVELGRSGGAVVNVVTKSGSNHMHGSGFYYLRDSAFDAQHAFTDVKPSERQHQAGFTLGGRLTKDKAFFYTGFDEHVMHIPAIVRFLDGLETVTPFPGDYEAHDQDLVYAAAEDLSALGGEFRSALRAGTGLGKVDWNLSPRQYVSMKLNVSRFGGENNVYFDPTSPITSYSVTENGTEHVATETASISLTSGWTFRLKGVLRAQFSRDLQRSEPNSTDVRTRIHDWIDAFGRSSIMPRETREHRLHVGDTFTYEGERHSWKFGGDAMFTWVRNFFPMLFGGEYIFDDIRVSPWTFQPQTYGMWITPLRAYAHGMPRYYTQNFGSGVSNPDSNDYAWFVQDTVRVNDHLAVTLGLRYDLQTFRSEGLISNPLWPDSGKVPLDPNNFAPRAGFAYSLGNRRPFVIRGGYGLFYTRIPQIYNSAVETGNGFNGHLFLDASDYWDRQVFPAYPNPLAGCSPKAASCPAPESVAGKLTADVSAFSHDFVTPSVTQASLGVEREVANRMAVGASYLYVRGQHLIRARDVNLPAPQIVEYPVYNETGSEFLGNYYALASFADWQMRSSLSCPYAPCVNDVARPIPELGAINVFESAATSVYHGLTISARRQMTRGLYFRVGYTWARAVDDGQDALVAGQPATVQNSYSPSSERGLSSTDQRQRFVVSWSAEPRPFHRDHEVLKTMFNGWRLSSIYTFGTGRPINAKVVGDANGDGNSENDRLPGVSRNSFTGPDYATADLRITRTLRSAWGYRIELTAESFNLFNRVNKRVDITGDGFENSAARFVYRDVSVGGTHYPAQFRLSSGFLKPSNAYAARQMQFSVKFRF
jgi:hypothetical protein